MKKIIGISFSLFVVFFLTTSVFSVTKKDPRFATSGNPGGITYIVDVNMSNVVSPCYTYQITITNEEGTPVSAPRIYHPGIHNYIFHENGPVNGTRIARMEKLNGQPPVACSLMIYCSPSSQTNNFRNGSTYMFHLTPRLVHGVPISQ